MTKISKTLDDSLPSLSQETVDKLCTLKLEGNQEFNAMIVSLIDNGWSLRIIAAPLGVSHSIISIWKKKYDGSVPIPETEKLPETVPKRVKSIYSKYSLSVEESEQLKNLTEEASKVRRYTDTNSASRKAANELEDLLYLYNRVKGVSLAQLGIACGVSRSAVAQRLRNRKKKNQI